jgi:hypothetical protein
MKGFTMKFILIAVFISCQAFFQLDAMFNFAFNDADDKRMKSIKQYENRLLDVAKINPTNVLLNSHAKHIKQNELNLANFYQREKEAQTFLFPLNTNVGERLLKASEQNLPETSWIPSLNWLKKPLVQGCNLAKEGAAIAADAKQSLRFSDYLWMGGGYVFAEGVVRRVSNENAMLGLALSPLYVAGPLAALWLKKCRFDMYPLATKGLHDTDQTNTRLRGQNIAREVAGTALRRQAVASENQAAILQANIVDSANQIATLQADNAHLIETHATKINKFKRAAREKDLKKVVVRKKPSINHAKINKPQPNEQAQGLENFKIDLPIGLKYREGEKMPVSDSVTGSILYNFMQQSNRKAEPLPSTVAPFSNSSSMPNYSANRFKAYQQEREQEQKNKTPMPYKPQQSELIPSNLFGSRVTTNGVCKLLSVGKKFV